jgi:hypothetical protein
MDCLEQDAAKELRELNFLSSWGCKEGVFLSSEDAFRIIKLIRALKVWCKPQTKRESFNEVTDMLRKALDKRVGTLFEQKKAPILDDKQSGKGLYKPDGTCQLDLE